MDSRDQNRHGVCPHRVYTFGMNNSLWGGAERKEFRLSEGNSMKFLSRLLKDDEELTRKRRQEVEVEKLSR